MQNIYGSEKYNFIYFIAVPAPTSVMLSAGPHTPMHPNGSLSCIVHLELSLEVDIQVTVNTLLTGPPGFNSSQHAIGGILAYTTMQSYYI